MLFFVRKEKDTFFTNELSMEDMRQINIEVHMGHRSLSTREEHWIFFYKTPAKLFRPAEIFENRRSMLKNVKQKDPPFCRPFANHINIISESHVIVGCIHRGIGITFGVVVNTYLLISDNVF